MRRAFTIVELLVVIGIITILAGVLLPVLSKVRGQSNRVACRAHLRDLGASMAMYFTDSKGRLPAVNTMPSVKPAVNNDPSIVELLKPYIKSATGVFRCPSDQITKATAGGFETYFEREGSSYQYNPFLVVHAGKKTQDTLAYSMGHPELLTILDEYEPFHGKAGTVGSMNHLFGDLRVGSVGE
jgi:prepilin-type N-terminal cleavage/methylation domain-containing protein